jgi:hypothetical protein
MWFDHLWVNWFWYNWERGYADNTEFLKVVRKCLKFGKHGLNMTNYVIVCPWSNCYQAQNWQITQANLKASVVIICQWRSTPFTLTYAYINSTLYRLKKVLANGLEFKWLKLIPTLDCSVSSMEGDRWI